MFLDKPHLGARNKVSEEKKIKEKGIKTTN